MWEHAGEDVSLLLPLGKGKKGGWVEPLDLSQS